MAVRYWVGPSGSCSFQNTAYWSTARGGAGGASVPDSTDEAYIIDGDSKINQGMDNETFLGSLYVSFDGSIGAEGDPFISGCNSITVNRVGSESYFGSVDDPGAPVVQLQVFDGSIGQVTWSEGYCTTIYLGSSGVFNALSGHITTLSTAGMGVKITQCAVETYNQYGGNSTSNETMTNINIYGGVFRLTGVADIDGSGTGFIKVFPGGVYIHNSSGTIDFIEVYPGAVASSQGADSKFVITGGNVWVTASYFEQSPVAITGNGATSPGRRGFGY